MLSTTCVFLVGLSVFFSAGVGCSDLGKIVNSTETCGELYEKGVHAYLDDNFYDCVHYLENANKKYKSYVKKLQNCRLKCQDKAQNSKPLFQFNIENLLFYERAVKATLCIIKCKNKSKDLRENMDITRDVESIFEDMKPYEYLHMCYYRINKPQEAASAAFTYLVSHPDDKIMSNNLKHYTKLKDVNSKKIINFEAKDYVYLFAHGLDAYANQQWDNVVRYIELSLADLLYAEDECRAQCEGSFDQGFYLDMIPSIANHFAHSLKCKRKCRDKLNSLNGSPHEDLLASHYHYLQFAYYNTNELRKACEAVASYLLFFPDDETMLRNKNYYQSLPNVKKDFFTSRHEAEIYVYRQTYEDKLLNYIDKEFVDLTTEATPKDASRRLQIVWTEKQLRGEKRVVFDGLATSRECGTFLNVAKMFAKIGDGYGGQISPHTEMEKFEGLSLSRFIFLIRIGLLNLRDLVEYLDVTERARNTIQDRFNLKKELYFSFTHLVCRSALSDSPKNRTDFSHEIHADNCIILEDDFCDRSSDAFTWRDYSAIVYLNDDFDGGEFIFSADRHGNHIQGMVEPKCGRMVAFSSGKENLHGVKAVKDGKRCAIGLWFTFDHGHREVERDLAFTLLKSDWSKSS